MNKLLKMQQKSVFQKIKEAGSHTIIYGLGSVLQAALGFVLIPLYTRYFTTDMYGVLALVNLCGSIAGSFFFSRGFFSLVKIVF